MNIDVIGWYNHDNIGDEAYKVAFPILFSGHSLNFLEGLDRTTSADLVILGGGDILYPSFTDDISTVPNIPKILASVTLTTNSDFDRLSLFNKKFVRDHRSVDVARERGYDVNYLPDFTFVLRPDREIGRGLLHSSFKKLGHDLYDKVVVVVVSNYLAYNHLDSLTRDYTTFLKLSQDIAQVADTTDASFVFLPFSTRDPHDDRMTNSWVAGRSKYYKKNLVVWDRLSVQDTLNIISAADVVVSSRLHCSIFSTIAGVPFIDLTHHTKNLGFVETVGKLEWSLPFWEFSIRQYRNTLNQLLSSGVPNGELLQFTQLSREQLKNAVIL